MTYCDDRISFFPSSRYADRAKSIKNKAVMNEDRTAAVVRGLREEIAQLKNQLANGGPVGGGGGGASMPNSGAIEEELKQKYEGEMVQVRRPRYIHFLLKQVVSGGATNIHSLFDMNMFTVPLRPDTVTQYCGVTLML
jgi:hypothetical protein